MKPHKQPETAYRHITDKPIKIPTTGSRLVQVAKGTWIIPKQNKPDEQVISDWYGRA